MAMSILAAVPCLGAGTENDSRNPWRRYPDLPDPVGFGGMFAGVLEGRLVVGGGSQFRDKPVWLQGTKSLSDRVYSLGAIDASWVEETYRLPQTGGHFASASADDAIYLVGGVSQTGVLNKCRVLKKVAGRYVIEELADLPVPLVYGAAAILGGRLYVAGGQNDPAVKAASVQTWCLDVSRPGAVWERGGDLPGPGVFVPSMGSDGKSVFLFGGMAFDGNGAMVPSKRAYRCDVSTGDWSRIADLPEARVGAATPCPLWDGSGLLLIGGYAEVFPGLPREHPGFSEQTLVYSDVTGQWGKGPWLPKSPVIDRDSPSDPDAGPMVAAPCVMWNGYAVVVSGESRAAVRTPTVVGLPLSEPVRE